MSERAPLTELPLFAAPAPVKAVHDRAETEHAAFLTRVRLLLAGIYARRGIAICADQVHEVMEKYRIKLPAGASPNLLGSMFSGWPRARATGQHTRSKRPGANGNLLMTWVIE